jgi:hypothetical protein
MHSLADADHWIDGLHLNTPPQANNPQNQPLDKGAFAAQLSRALWAWGPNGRHLQCSPLNLGSSGAGAFAVDRVCNALLLAENERSFGWRRRFCVGPVAATPGGWACFRASLLLLLTLQHTSATPSQPTTATAVSSFSMATHAASSGLGGDGASSSASSERQLCLLCPPGTSTRARRLDPPASSRPRDKARPAHRPWGLGRAHQRCIRRVLAGGVTREDSAQLEGPFLPSLEQPLPPHAPAEEQSPIPTPTSAPTLSEQFRVFGHARAPPSPRSARLAWQAMQLSQRARGEPIAGQVKQLPLTDQQLLAEWGAVARETAAAVGVASPEFLVDAKLLLAAPSRGLQSVHWDTARTREAHAQLACILVCSSGASSTALPTFPTNDDLSFSTDPAAMRRVAHLLQPQHYASSPAQPGEVIVFRLSTPHFGVANSMPQGNRVVLFGLLSSTSQPGQDALQVFPWLYTRYAFGCSSLEFARSLVEGRAHSPLQRLQGDEGAASREEAEACLRAWSLFDEYRLS